MRHEFSSPQVTPHPSGHLIKEDILRCGTSDNRDAIRSLAAALVLIWITIGILVGALAIVLIAPPAAALTISFNDWDISGSQKVTIYNSTSEEPYFIGNTSSKGIPLNNSESYMILLEPDSTDYFSNPSLIAPLLLNWIETNFLGLLAVVLIVGALAIVAGRRGK